VKGDYEIAHHDAMKWLMWKWKTSHKGHPWLKAGDFHIVVCAAGQSPFHYRLFINERRGQTLYSSENTAKLAAFDAIANLKQCAK